MLLECTGTWSLLNSETKRRNVPSSTCSIKRTSVRLQYFHLCSFQKAEPSYSLEFGFWPWHWQCTNLFPKHKFSRWITLLKMLQVLGGHHCKPSVLSICTCSGTHQSCEQAMVFSWYQQPTGSVFFRALASTVYDEDDWPAIWAMYSLRINAVSSGDVARLGSSVQGPQYQAGTIHAYTLAKAQSCSCKRHLHSLSFRWAIYHACTTTCWHMLNTKMVVVFWMVWD